MELNGLASAIILVDEEGEVEDCRGEGETRELGGG